MSASTSAQPAETILVGTPQRLATQSSLARQIANLDDGLMGCGITHLDALKHEEAADDDVDATGY